jgi:hypothetical protein
LSIRHKPSRPYSGQPVKNRWPYRLLILFSLAAFTVWLEPTRVIWGWLRGEAFYEGRPTSYWAEQIRPWQNRSMVVRGEESIGNFSDWHYYEADRLPFLHWLGQHIDLATPAWPAVLDGAPKAAAVLDELLHHADPLVRNWAVEGRERIQTPAKGPMLQRHYRTGQTPRPVPGSGQAP